MSLDSRMMAVPLRVSADGKSLEPGEATALFPVRLPVGPLVPGGGRREYVVSADGQRFLVLTAVNDSALPPITLIQHWQPPKEP